MKLSIQDLSVIYNADQHQLLALDGVSLELTAGRITALVGESGSGKTTLGKTLMGLLPADAYVQGSIQMNQTELLGLSEAEYNEFRWSRLAMLFQNGAENLNPVHRILDQVAEPLIQKQGLAKGSAGQAAERALQELELDPALGQRFAHELSGGELQRCLLAMTFILDPEAVVLDEPTAALDAMTKALMGRVMLKAKEQGKALLVITHDLDLASSIADQVLILYLGQVMEVLPARDMFLAPYHPYTLALGRSYPSLETHRELGGIRGDAFYRVLHRHREKNGAVRAHAHVISPEASHEEGHLSPQGCLFRERCTQAVDDCAAIQVPLLDVCDHQVRCLRQGIVTALELQGVCKRFGNIQALGHTDISLRAGETYCLVGESGSGKSTLALIAAGTLQPDQGLCFFQGQDMDQWIKKDYLSLAQRIGMIHQNPAQAVSHRFSVLDIVAEPLRIQKHYLHQENIKRRVLKALQDVHLSSEPEFIQRYPHELNMGALQRVCIARALVTDPAFLVADEPTSSLDPSVQAKVLKLILDLQIEKGLTMLFVTHDLGLARKIGDRTGVLLAGSLVESGPTGRIFERPAHPYTKCLIDGARGRIELGYEFLGSKQAQGCSFAGRCSLVQDICLDQAPGLTRAGHGGHFVCCHFPLGQ